MLDVILRASFFFGMIVLAYILKKIGVVRKSDAEALGRIIMNITLPAAILTSFRTYVFDISIMLITLIGFLSTIFMSALGYLISMKKSREERIFYMLNLPAYNIGNFTLPFVSGFLGAVGTVATCLFDMGNALMCVGGNLVVTELAVDGRKKGRSIPLSLLSVFTKPSVAVYTLMTILAVIGVKLPDIVFDFAASISPANGIIAMFMIGIMFEFTFSKENLKEVVIVNVLRLALAALIAYFFYSLTDFSYEVRKAAAITAFAPISSAAGAFCQDLKGNQELEGFASTLSIMLSLIIIPILLMVL
ncbi:MAG TPA: AEC family transporter [Candidatus Ornithospirochaeta stercorigallinarum]|nr:AEC family transporter [Candidatus Ornithospirochaeta stercorigallinarum]